ncbi:bifunctional SulP family inorganic anion transporter/carbonic anhydrase [Pollutibacter soli]|uniref:bifunctional SulP family inorganic anion transporter/carbonic anhydrase n=1 Tax=Pollutibacter soli TaxID=3034157 RepID=UPI003013601D
MKASELKNDVPASIVVFLVALPLCLGVALASGAPLLSGIISGIIGGIIVGILSRSNTSVSGPAAGLAAVVFAAITSLGDFEIFLTAVFIAGCIQLLMGFLKAGIIANYVPSNVIKGLLAAIGILLILKQIPHALGYDPDAFDDLSFFQRDGENTFSALYHMLNFILPGAFIISMISILVMIFWDKSPMKKFRFFPASLFVVILGVVLNIIFKKYFPGIALESSHLVNIPVIDTNNLSGYLHLPTLESFSNVKVYTVAFTIAIVASLETLLNIEAVDKLDPHKRESPPNRELIAQGVGNITAGLFGGIPVTSVIVRSSVNINSGNSTKLSAILHGVFMLISVLALGSLLNLIPLASLAAILLITGYKLAKVELFKKMYRKGWHQFIPFVATILAIVFTDLLIGVLIGLAISVFYLLRSNFRNPFKIGKEKLAIGEVVKLELSDEVSFLNKASIKETLWNIPEKSKVIIDGSRSGFIDEDVLEVLEDFKSTVAPEKNIQLNVIGIREKYEIQDNLQFLNVLDRKTQQKLTPDAIMKLLKAGNERFLKGESTDKYFQSQVSATADVQHPMAVIVCCIDSGTSPEIVFDSGIGDLLIVRIAGNIASPAIIGSIELSVKKIGAKLVVVMGHSNCGAINAALQNTTDDHIYLVTEKIQSGISLHNIDPEKVDLKDVSQMNKITWMNAESSISEILSESSYLNEMVGSGDIGVVAAFYDTASGKVSFGELKKAKSIKADHFS